MDRGAARAAIQECDSSDCCTLAERLAPARCELEVQLGQRLVAWCDGEGKGAGRDSVRAWADGINGGHHAPGGQTNGLNLLLCS